MGCKALLSELLTRIDCRRDWTNAMKPSSGFLRVYKYTEDGDGMPVGVHFDGAIATAITTIPVAGYCAGKHQEMQLPWYITTWVDSRCS